MAFNQQGFNNQNGQNPMNMNMMNMNMNMNMNYFNMQNELLKCVMEGMGEQPKNDYKENLNFIMNYVPFDYGSTSNVGKGNLMTLTFKNNALGGGDTTMRIGEDTELKVVFEEYSRKKNINVNNHIFLYNGNKYNVNTCTGTLKSNDFRENIPILVYKS